MEKIIQRVMWLLKHKNNFGNISNAFEVKDNR